MYRGPRALLRFDPTLNRHENKGLKFAMDQIEELKVDGNHITAMLSYSDLIQLGGYAAVEYTGGPVMLFKMGRIDGKEGDATQAESGDFIANLRRAGFSSQEIVALAGSHTLGFAKADRTGFQGRWTQNPHVFDNSYFKEILLGEKSKFLKTSTENSLHDSSDLRQFVEQYAQDERVFFDQYAKAHVKLSELGQEEHLLSEFDNDKPQLKAPVEENGVAIGTFNDPQNL